MRVKASRVFAEYVPKAINAQVLEFRFYIEDIIELCGCVDENVMENTFRSFDEVRTLNEELNEYITTKLIEMDLVFCDGNTDGVYTTAKKIKEAMKDAKMWSK